MKGAPDEGVSQEFKSYLYSGMWLFIGVSEVISIQLFDRQKKSDSYK